MTPYFYVTLATVGCTPAGPGPGDTATPSSIPVVEAPTTEERVDGLFVVEVGAVFDSQTFEPGEEWTPFSYAAFQTPPSVVTAKPGEDGRRDICFTGDETTSIGPLSNLDIGPSVDIDVGEARLELERIRDDDTIEYWYDDKWQPVDIFADMPISLAYESTGLTMPPRLELVDLDLAVLNFVEDGILNLSWIATSQPSELEFVTVVVLLYHPDTGAQEYFSCALADDGQATVEPGLDLMSGEVDLYVGRRQARMVEHSVLGTILGLVYRDAQIGLSR